MESIIYRMAFGIVKSEAEAEDAAQEAAIRVYRNLHLFRGEAQFRTWVLTITRNVALERLRKTTTRREDSIDAEREQLEGDATPAALISWREVPETVLAQKEVAAMLRRAVEELPEIYRSVVVLRDMEELDARETAAALGITEGAVKVRLHRARAMLQKTLAPQLKDLGPKRRGLFAWGRG